MRSLLVSMEPPWKTVSSFFGGDFADCVNEALFRVYPYLWPLGYNFREAAQVKKVFKGHLFSVESHLDLAPYVGKAIGDTYPMVHDLMSSFSDVLVVVNEDKTYFGSLFFFEEGNKFLDEKRGKMEQLPKLSLKGKDFSGVATVALSTLSLCAKRRRIPRFDLGIRQVASGCEVLLREAKPLFV